MSSGIARMRTPAPDSPSSGSYTCFADPAAAGSLTAPRRPLCLAEADTALGPTGPAMNESDFKSLLDRIQAADPGAWDELMRLVYADLKRIAHGQMARISPGQTLSTTVLVHEAFEKLAT